MLLEFPFKYAEIPGIIFDALGDWFKDAVDENPTEGSIFNVEVDTATPPSSVFVVADFDEMKEGTWIIDLFLS